MPSPKDLAIRIENSVAKIPQIIANAEVLAINDILGSMSRRIFNEGGKTDGSRIGQYSSKNTLLGAKSFRNKGAADSFFANSSELQWVRFKGRSLAVLPGGYKRLREIQGLETGFVNLQYTGKLSATLDIGTINDNPAIGLTTEKSADIVEGLEKKYGVIFIPQDEEVKIAIDLAGQYIIEQFQKEIDSWAL